MSEDSATKNTDSVLNDGTLTFRVRRRDGQESTHEVDLLLLKLTCERCEQEHGLQVVEGRVQPTAEFLTDLASRLSQWIAGCTPTLAWQAWIAATDEMGRLKN
jgi:hypothetical protein